MGKTKTKLPRWATILAVVTVVTIIAISLVLADRLTEFNFEPSLLFYTIGFAIFFIFLFALPSFRRWILNIIGEDDNSIKERQWRFLVALVILFILFFYILLGDAQVAVPSTFQFNIIIVSSTLGGLVLAAATISRGKRAKRRELLAVAQKLIMATLLFVFFTALFFIVELIGGIDPDSFEITSLLNWFRGTCYWSAFVSIFAGGILFSLGIIDLVIALTRMRKRLSA
jgi:hypothetical protein